MDDTTPADTEGRWVTYAELADLRGISRKAAARLTLRHSWRRQPGNDGATRVFVPTDMTHRQPFRSDRPLTPLSDGVAQAEALADANRRSDEANKRADAAQALTDRALAMLADAETRADALREAKDGEIATLHGVVEGLRANVARSVSLIDGFREERDQAQQALAGEHARADALRDRLDAIQAQLGATETAAELARRHAQEAQEAAEALRQAEAARKARGRWARLRAAWRGE